MFNTKTTPKETVIGTPPNNQMRFSKGLDAIDLWAMGIGQAEKDINKMRPRKKHVQCV